MVQDVSVRWGYRTYKVTSVLILKYLHFYSSPNGDAYRHVQCICHWGDLHMWTPTKCHSSTTLGARASCILVYEFPRRSCTTTWTDCRLYIWVCTWFLLFQLQLWNIAKKFQTKWSQFFYVFISFPLLSLSLLTNVVCALCRFTITPPWWC